MKNPVAETSPKDWPWADSLDAVIAAPAHHTVLLEDRHVRVLRTRIRAGEVVPLHTHRWGGVAYVESCCHFLRKDEHGKTLFDSRQAGDLPSTPCVQRMQPLPPHTVENLGQTEISILIVEIKDSADPGVQA